MNRGRITAFIALMIALAMLIYPQESFEASVEGLKLWFEIVLPALLPFFAMADILMGLGVVSFLGALLEPIMRPLFRIPGVGGFAVAMGLAGGYPIGARITGELHRRGLCTRVEAERLLAFANTADPLFIVGAVAVGMFGRPEIGAAMLIAHYLGVVMVGLLLRFYRTGEPETPLPKKQRSEGYLARAIREMDKARRADGRSFGQLFGDTIRETFASMLFIGGCIMMFSVLTTVLDAAGIMKFLIIPLEAILRTFKLEPSLATPIVHGFFETTLGSKSASAASAPLIQRAVVASLVIGWSGLSVHSQVSVMILGTRIRMLPYMFARLGHGIIAGIVTAILLGPGMAVTSRIAGAIPVLSTATWQTLSLGARFVLSLKWASIVGLTGTALGGLVRLSSRIRIIPFRH